ncbi:hypothetical protein C8R47DRAFT_103744 [Mycena vitilis]|nr:hypothetical protein C8R47DRAFT_103744 [Mycena vitilis]
MSHIDPDNIKSGPSVLVPTYPFTNSPVVDAILRSRDGADFYIVQAILSLVSPVFATMFRLPQPDTTPEIPVVDMDEDATTLDRVLRFIYPAAYPIFDSLDDLRHIIELVIAKYDMQCEVPKAQQCLERYCASDPLGVFTVACKYGWKDIALAAAKESLKRPIRTHNAEAPPALDGLTAIGYHNLLHYHYLCSQAAMKTTQDLTWTSPLFGVCREGPCRHADEFPFYRPHHEEYFPGCIWVGEYLRAMRQILSVTPGTNVRDGSEFHTALGKGRCTRPGCDNFESFRKFVTVQWPVHLEAEIAKVRLKL